MRNLGVRNAILQNLRTEDFAALARHLSHVRLSPGQNLTVPGDAFKSVYFPENGICAVEARAPGSEGIEVGLIGCEGMTDHVREEGDVAVFRILVQIAGSALCVSAGDYARWIAGRPDACRVMARYQQAMAVQVSYTAMAHGSFSVDRRVARLLLMMFDRTGGRDLPLVHDQIARMLSVRRSGVTTTLHKLEGLGLIRSERKLVQMKDRTALEALAGGAYGIPEREYRRLLGPALEPLATVACAPLTMATASI